MKKRISIGIILFVFCALICSCTSKNSNGQNINNSTPETKEECQHIFSEQSVSDPTCTADGKKTLVCEKCGFNDIEYLANLSHTMKEAEIYPPTCTEEGYSIFKCECGFSYKGNIVAPSGHKHKSEQINPDSCVEPIYTHISCENCDFAYDTDFIAQNHSFVQKITPPLATKNGFTENTCSKCGYSYISDITQYSDICASPYGDSEAPIQKGLDLSNYNHEKDSNGNYLPIDFQSIKDQGYDFVILKIGSSHSGKSQVFEEDYAGAKAAGLEVGVYYYTYSSTRYGNSNDAKDVVEWLKGKQLEYPVYYDLEDEYIGDLSKEQYTENITYFIETLQMNGYYGALYVNEDWLYNKLKTEEILSKFDIWFAKWSDSEDPAWSDISSEQPFSMWQATSKHRVDGLEADEGYVDLNFCYKDYSAIMKRWGLNGFEKEEIEEPEEPNITEETE